jgi:hypothetical protein
MSGETPAVIEPYFLFLWLIQKERRVSEVREKIFDVFNVLLRSADYRINLNGNFHALD